MTVKLEIDKEAEESKIHNPFLAENFLKRELLDSGLIPPKDKRDRKQKNSKNKQFYGDQELEQMLNLDRGIINKLTGSYLIAFDVPGKDDR